MFEFDMKDTFGDSITVVGDGHWNEVAVTFEVKKDNREIDMLLTPRKAQKLAKALKRAAKAAKA